MGRTFPNARLIVTTIVLLAGPCLAGTVPEEAQRHFNRGMAAVEMAGSVEDYEIAIEEFDKALSLAPDWPDALYNLGIIQERAGKYGDAARSLRRYLQLVPDSPDAAEIRAMADKAEFKAEQVLTDDDIMDILTSLTDQSRWQMRGITNGGLFIKDKWVTSITRSGNELTVSFPSGTCGLNGKMEMDHMVTGNKLEFGTFYCLCDTSVQSDSCPVGMRYWLEVVSRRKVTMQMRLWHPVIQGAGGGTEDASFEFIRR